jgi:hypothetical protein
MRFRLLAGRLSRPPAGSNNTVVRRKRENVVKRLVRAVFRLQQAARGDAGDGFVINTIG